MILTYLQSEMPDNRRNPVQLEYESTKSLTEKDHCDLIVPAPGSKILLHSCCAPCSGAMIEEMKEKFFLDVTIFFYNPNIHPRKEYEIRKNENKRFAQKLGIDFVDCDYDSGSWFERMNGLEYEPERGIRCLACFDIRMEVTASYGIEHGFDFFTTTNASSRWKDVMQINHSGDKASSLYQNKIKFWKYNWQTNEMTSRKYQINVSEKFYKQEYCGCSYSLRDSNIWRVQQGIPMVKIGGEVAGIGERYFSDVTLDEADESEEIVNSFFQEAKNHFGDQKRIERIKPFLL